MERRKKENESSLLEYRDIMILMKKYKKEFLHKKEKHLIYENFLVTLDL